jgi:hypothetical protein
MIRKVGGDAATSIPPKKVTGAFIAASLRATPAGWLTGGYARQVICTRSW